LSLDLNELKLNKTEKKVMKTFLFIIASKRIKSLGINLTKKAEDSYTDN